jgi:hypothetical protein
LYILIKSFPLLYESSTEFWQSPRPKYSFLLNPQLNSLFHSIIHYFLSLLIAVQKKYCNCLTLILALILAFCITFMLSPIVNFILTVTLLHIFCWELNRTQSYIIFNWVHLPLLAKKCFWLKHTEIAILFYWTIPIFFHIIAIYISVEIKCPLIGPNSEEKTWSTLLILLC